MRIRNLLINLAGWGLCIVVAVGLIGYIREYHQKQRLHEEELIQQAEERAEAARQKEIERQKATARQEVYNNLIAGIGFDSFVFWGDNDMEGEKGYSLASSLSKVSSWKMSSLLTETFGEYYIRGGETLTIPSATVYDMSVTNETLQEILVRSGVDPLIIAEEFEIPPETNPVNVFLQNGRSEEELHFAEQRTARLGSVSISGIQGTITTGDGEYDELHPILAFVRTEAGSGLRVAEGTEIELNSGKLYLENTPIFFFDHTGELEEDEDIESFVSDLERMVDRYAGDRNDDDDTDDRTYIVICTSDENSYLNDLLNEAFGNHYIRNNTSADDMSKDACTDLATTVYDRLDEQGCFENVKEQVAAAAEEFERINNSDTTSGQE